MSKEIAKRHLDFIIRFPLICTGILGAFTIEQKKRIKQRDREFGINHNKGGCQFPKPHDCNGDKRVEVHHVLPQRYCHEHGIDPDFEENGITLCEHAHQRIIHPDMNKARQRYRENNNSYQEVFSERQEKLKADVPYWNTIFDRALHAIAIRNTQRRDAKT